MLRIIKVRIFHLLRAGRSVVRTPVVARFSVPVQTEVHPASCAMCTGSHPPGGKAAKAWR